MCIRDSPNAPSQRSVGFSAKGMGQVLRSRPMPLRAAYAMPALTYRRVLSRALSLYARATRCPVLRYRMDGQRHLLIELFTPEVSSKVQN
eukprot:2544069-Rhodomonas_salina.1